MIGPVRKIVDQRLCALHDPRYAFHVERHVTPLAQVDEVYVGLPRKNLRDDRETPKSRIQHAKAHNTLYLMDRSTWFCVLRRNFRDCSLGRAAATRRSADSGIAEKSTLGASSQRSRMSSDRMV
ncbi:MAG TPA: hypothetical protein VFB22_14180 [Candidatus Baltobacteraceae bacterium]|nr:hypothetical protein [Candidatus Baltobacteraceae bacterium]